MSASVGDFKYAARQPPMELFIYFELGTVRNLPTPDEIDLPTCPGKARARRIILWRTTFPQRHLYASAFHERDFQSLPGNLGVGSELRNLLKQAIEQILRRSHS
jgi:hypothetical protein